LELVRNPEDASTSEGPTDVEKLSRSLAVKEEELLESKRECADLKLTNVQLLNRAEVSEQKSQESTKVEEELLASEDSREKLVADLASWKTRCNRYRQGYHYWKAKAVRYLAELSFVPLLRNMQWSFGFHWGFENYRFLYVNRGRFDIDLATVKSDYLRLPQHAIDQMADSCLELIPDAPEVNSHGHGPTPALPPEPDGPEIDPSDDEGEDVA
jgi:hypothetical protein